jgi:hypothetical protein
MDVDMQKATIKATLHLFLEQEMYWNVFRSSQSVVPFYIYRGGCLDSLLGKIQ